MLRVGLTGGIAAGKSLAASALRELGAVLIDADLLARTVVQPGTDGLREVVDAFGPGVLLPDGALDRAALGARIFDDPNARSTLNGIIHPRVRDKAAEAEAAAETSSEGAAVVVVHDIPLLVETGQEDRFHLVLVVDAPEEERVRRMIDNRGLTEQESLSRIRAQADAVTRNAAADVVLDNSGGPDDLLDAVQRVWSERLLPFAENLQDGRVAKRWGGPVLVENPDWPRQAGLLVRRLSRVDPRILGVHHIGSTAVPGLPAADVIDLQVTVSSLQDADELSSALAAAGFPRPSGPSPDTVPDRPQEEERHHCNADPGRPVNVHVRVHGSPGWRFALAFRDWLRANSSMAAAYLAEKERCCEIHRNDPSIAGYSVCKDSWLAECADPRLKTWIDDASWSPERAPVL
ncbi:dephospho-CoA kinase [Arthrobacter pigmenti]|uniref:Dephospho-CoA kinase n=1 Tax=Arthrobacter pigmenti TaxID=271432 RepID=A0A846RNU3_9MICC|nr:dephospho-CoA kinase [Arthrobacter pigmenti]NJC22282.1 dephospho-CoA kinase [Arthrobacter pigmenti]